MRQMLRELQNLKELDSRGYVPRSFYPRIGELAIRLRRWMAQLAQAVPNRMYEFAQPLCHIWDATDVISGYRWWSCLAGKMGEGKKPGHAPRHARASPGEMPTPSERKPQAPRLAGTAARRPTPGPMPSCRVQWSFGGVASMSLPSRDPNVSRKKRKKRTKTRRNKTGKQRSGLKRTIVEKNGEPTPRKIADTPPF